MKPDKTVVSKCPFCKEEIARGAIVCKHCGSKIQILKSKRKKPFWRSSFMFGFYCGIILMILLIYLYNYGFK
ncbi:MAG: hypothetical protein GY865_19160 [candidate division Zixibacteria bacterium]|nr:hypothetical protein [candidate division Zixibacteria bacterium]